MRSRFLRSVGYAALVGAALAAFPTVSRADTYAITSDHCTGGCGTGPFGYVTVTDLGSGTLDFTVALINGNGFVNTGFDASFGFNLNADPTITYSNLTPGWIVEGPSSPGLVEAVGSLHMDGTGFFEYGVLWGLQGGGNATAGPLHFTITATGLDLSDLQANALGQYFGIDIISGTTGNTGAVDVSSLTPVPEPSTLLLMGSALLGIGASVRNRIFRRTKQEVAVS